MEFCYGLPQTRNSVIFVDNDIKINVVLSNKVLKITSHGILSGTINDAFYPEILINMYFFF